MTTTPFHITTVSFNFCFLLYVVKQADAEEGIEIKAVYMRTIPLRELFWGYFTTPNHQPMPLICQTPHCSTDSFTVVKIPRQTILGTMKGQLCIFLPLDQFSEQRANSDGLPTEALGLWFSGLFGEHLFLFACLFSFVWLGFYRGYKLLLFFISDYHICLTGKHGNQQLF